MLALAVGASILTLGTAEAQNLGYAPGDLVLYFQNPGGSTGSDQTVMVSLGNSATVFRDASSSLLNMANIGMLLSTTFGADWYNQETLYMGVAANQGTSLTSSALVNGDPSRTIYMGQSRNGVGEVGSANSVGYNISNFVAATNINNQNNVLEVNGTTSAEAFNTTISQVENQNPFVVPGQQGTAYGVFNGGVQYQFGSGSFGSFGEAGSVEGVLDLYRIQAKNDIIGQYGAGEPTGEGDYLGSLSIDQNGNISYTTSAIPEPSTYALLALAGVAGVIALRRRQAAARA